MNTYILDFSSGPAPDYADYCAWRQARITRIAAIISDASPNLNDDLDVIRALYAAGMTCREWIDVFDQAVELVRGTEEFG